MLLWAIAQQSTVISLKAICIICKIRKWMSLGLTVKEGMALNEPSMKSHWHGLFETVLFAFFFSWFPLATAKTFRQHLTLYVIVVCVLEAPPDNWLYEQNRPWPLIGQEWTYLCLLIILQWYNLSAHKFLSLCTVHCIQQVACRWSLFRWLAILPVELWCCYTGAAPADFQLWNINFIL